MKIKKIPGLFLFLLLASFLIFQSGCKKKEDVTPASGNMEVALVGSFPNTAYFNALAAKLSIQPLSSNLPVFITAEKLNDLTHDQRARILMAYRSGKPITVIYPDQAAATKLVEITGHALPLNLTAKRLIHTECISLALLPHEVKDYVIGDVIPDKDINQHVQLFYDWIQKTVTSGNHYGLKKGNDATNIATEAMQYSHAQTVTGSDETVLQVSGYIQAIYNWADNTWWVFPSLTLAVNPMSLNTSIRPYVDGYMIPPDNTNWINPENMFDASPASAAGTTSVSTGTSQTFNAGISFSLTGPSISLGGSSSFTSSTTNSIPATVIQNESDISTGYVIWAFSWNQNPGYASYPITWVWQFPYVAANAGMVVGLQGEAVIWDPTTTAIYGEVDLSSFTFTLPTDTQTSKK